MRIRIEIEMADREYEFERDLLPEIDDPERNAAFAEGALDAVVKEAKRVLNG